MDLIGLIHTGLALIALASGLFVFRKVKGGPLHRKIGWIYAASMIGLNATALMIYDLFGYFGPFHWMALFSLATVLAALVPAIRRKPADGWIEVHAQFMSWSYVGLLAATAAEIFTRVPGLDFWWAVIVASVAIILGGAVYIRRCSPLERLLGRK